MPFPASKDERYFHLWIIYTSPIRLACNPLKPAIYHYHIHPLQAANCCRNSRLVVDKDDLKSVAKEKYILLLLKQVHEQFLSSQLSCRKFNNSSNMQNYVNGAFATRELSQIVPFTCGTLLDGCKYQTPDIDPMLVYCWAIVYDGGPTLKQHWFIIYVERGRAWPMSTDVFSPVCH